MAFASENTILQTIKACFAGRIAEGALEFGDDAAIFTPTSAGTRRVVTTDAIQEELDFIVGLGPLESVGWRVISQNVSDLAAMGAKPVGFVWSLTVPPRWLAEECDWLFAFCRGARDAAEEYGIDLYGGDLSSSKGLFNCSVTAWGDVDTHPISRRGAQVKDWVCVSRPVGASAQGLEILLQERETLSHANETRSAREIAADYEMFARARSEFEQAALDAHLWPKAETTLGAALVGRANACMDISDGLGLDLSRLSASSQVGAVLHDWSAASVSARHGQDDAGALRDLGSGEEYALLFTIAQDVDLTQLRTIAPGLCIIGEIVEEPGLYLSEGGETRAIAAEGWDHFSGSLREK